MNKKQKEKLAAMLDAALWRDPLLAVETLHSNHKQNPDPRLLAHILLRKGTELSKDEKKTAGINPQAKIGSDVRRYFTDEGLKNCVEHAAELALAIVAIGDGDVKGWKKQGVKRVVFAPAPDCCEKCEALRGEYEIDKAPIPVLDTHLGCRCSYTMGGNAFD